MSARGDTTRRMANKLGPAPGPRDVWICSESELDAVVARNRLEPVLVRYRGKVEGRFRAPAQDVADLVAMLVFSDCYVRDMSIQTKGGTS